MQESSREPNQEMYSWQPVQLGQTGDDNRLSSLKLAVKIVESDPRLIALHKDEPPSPYLSRNTAPEANKRAAQPQIEDLVVHIAKRLEHYLTSGE